ncbi:MAG: PEP-CTERM sorting domain-containing protein, partial [Candidatus Omnitrophica bacterium]|nr:PEP-CTERM sorting domain-containing protein [Candidatus Omnitrophota bacterium]
MKKVFLSLLFMVILLGVSTSAHAVLIDWTDWTTSDSTNGFTAYGTMTTATTTVSVTYNNPLGVGFYQPTGGIDYWTDGAKYSAFRNPAISPYTSTFVDNIPTGTDIIALNKAGLQTLTFSEAIANPVFAFVSLNGNGYGFDQDFEILSVG